MKQQLNTKSQTPNNPKYWAEWALRGIGKKMQTEYNLSDNDLLKFDALAQEYTKKVEKLIEELKGDK